MSNGSMAMREFIDISFLAGNIAGLRIGRIRTDPLSA
jgi:hypothetical protein